MFFYLSDSYLAGMLIWIVCATICFLIVLTLRRRWRGTRKVTFCNAVLSVLLLLAVVTLSELAFAFAWDTTDAFNLTNVSQRWFRIHVDPQRKELRPSPSTAIIYRDNVSFPESIGPDEHHIMFVGDSFTFGHGVSDVEHRFSNLVRKQLSGGFRVSNLSDAGTDLFWVNAVADRVLSSPLHVDTIVYVMCLNDIETLDTEYQQFYGGMALKAPTNPVFRDTYLLNFLYFRMMQFRVSEVRDYYASLNEMFTGKTWAKMTQLLLQLNETCEQHGAKLRIVVFPFLHDDDGEYDCQDAHQAVVEFGRTHSVPVLDLAPELLPHLDKGLTVNPFDAHPNEKAHALAAAVIASDLKSAISVAD